MTADYDSDRARSTPTDPTGSAPGVRSEYRQDEPDDPDPVLSICVPTFNRPDLVRRAIDSIVRSASGREDEVEIIVSDNSPEVSERACRDALSAWQGRSRYVGNRQNVGIPANFNASIAQASGRYVLFVCDDDRLLPVAVPTILGALARGQDPVLLFQVVAVDDEGRVVRRQRFGHAAVLGPSDALYRLLSDNRFALFPGVVVQAAAYSTVGPFDADVGNATDIEMWVRLFSRYGVRTIPRTISAYTAHPGSATQSTPFDRDAVAQLMEIFDRARATGILSSASIEQCEVRYIHSIILATVFLQMRSGDLAGARKGMSLFRLPEVRSLGQTLAWMPVRMLFSVLVRCPPAFVRWQMTVLDRVVLVRRVGATGGNRQGRLQRL